MKKDKKSEQWTGKYENNRIQSIPKWYVPQESSRLQIDSAIEAEWVWLYYFVSFATCNNNDGNSTTFTDNSGS